MRRGALVFVVLAAALGLAAAGCGGEESVTATPETIEGETTTTETTTETTTTETTATETTDTETTETETTETTSGAEGDPVAGKEVFLGASSCGGCHTLADAGATGAVGPNFDETKPSYELSLDRVTNGQGGMPSFSGTLTEQQLADVAAYISSAAGS
ncbi:MAG: cytochrome c [Thermoleophilia bacterium]|nr:cytochrome c [Thermoleophilia bacterium]MDH5281878.1 cytochrome c [Thermoleophilia bacterium]